MTLVHAKKGDLSASAFAPRSRAALRVSGGACGGCVVELAGKQRTNDGSNRVEAAHGCRRARSTDDAARNHSGTHGQFHCARAGKRLFGIIASVTNSA